MSARAHRLPIKLTIVHPAGDDIAKQLPTQPKPFRLSIDSGFSKARSGPYDPACLSSMADGKRQYLELCITLFKHYDSASIGALDSVNLHDCIHQFPEIAGGLTITDIIVLHKAIHAAGDGRINLGEFCLFLKAACLTAAQKTQAKQHRGNKTPDRSSSPVTATIARSPSSGSTPSSAHGSLTRLPTILRSQSSFPELTSPQDSTRNSVVSEAEKNTVPSPGAHRKRTIGPIPKFELPAPSIERALRYREEVAHTQSKRDEIATETVHLREEAVKLLKDRAYAKAEDLLML